MNKQEFIERVKELTIFSKQILNVRLIDRDDVIKLIEQLDEPQKVIVSEEEAKFLETFDFNCESDITTALYHVSRTGFGYYLRDNNGIELKDLSEEFRELENRKRLIKAILDGYEVEKEKRYLVKVRGIGSNMCYLNRVGNKWIIAGIDEYTGMNIYTKHTREELEQAGFGEVFNSPLFEVEEVEE